MAVASGTEPVRIYVSYADEDAIWLRDRSQPRLVPWLQKCLAGHGVEIIGLADDLPLGTGWVGQIRQRISSADIALVLITRGLLAHSFFRDVELPEIVVRARAGSLQVVPVLVQACDLRGSGGLADFVSANPEPLVSWRDDQARWDEARFAILDAVLQVVDGLRPARTRAVNLVVGYCEDDARWISGDHLTGLVPLLEQGLSGDRVNVTVLRPALVGHVDALDNADLVLLVVSQDYLNSEAYAELRPWLLRRLERGDLGVLPIVTRHALLARDELLSGQRCLFADRPLIEWGADPEQWSEAQGQIVRAVRALVQHAREASPTPGETTPRPVAVPEASGHLIYISYSHDSYSDRECAETVYRFLTDHGMSVAMDSKVVSGCTFEHWTERAISEASHTVVIGSRFWAMDDRARHAWSLIENKGRGGRGMGHVVTILASPTMPDYLPPGLRDRQCVPLTQDGLESLLATLRDGPRGPGRSATAYEPPSADGRALVGTEAEVGDEVPSRPRALDECDDTGKQLGGMGGVTAGSRGFADGPDATEADDVDCTAFAPPGSCVGGSVMVQVYAHTPKQAEAVGRMAVEFDSGAERRGVTSLGTRISRGSRLTFELSFRELSVPDAVKDIVWRGNTGVASFEVVVPPDARLGSHVGTVRILQDTVPIGDITFKLEAVAEAAGERPQTSAPRNEPVGEARRYQTAFISYASKDRDEVLRCVRLLPAAGIRFFQDLLDLAPGERWEQELWRHIDESDVMLLFWSSAARESEWVGREWRYGLEHKGDDYIRPVIIEGPPPVPPPDELKHLHFDDRVGYFLRAARAGTSEAS